MARLQREFDTAYQAEQERHKEDHECLRALKTSSYEDHKDRNPLRISGTCRWVLSHPQFCEWRSGSYPLLWISADPGCGKSVLSKALVDDILPSNDFNTVCYFFFKDNEEQDNLPTALCALLHQLFSSQPHLLRHALPAWEQNRRKVRNETKTMWRIIRAAATDREARPIFCVQDALDECKNADRQQLIQLLCDLQQSTRSTGSVNRLKVLVTSRPYDDVQRWFGPATARWPQIRLRGEDENDTIREEINIVIEQQVQDLRREYTLSDTIYERILRSLQSMKHRTYLWLHLAMEEVRQACRDSIFPDDIDVISLPASVEEAYEHILRKIEAKQRAFARLILLIIVGARRPLRIEEMAHALSAARADERQSQTLTCIEPARLGQQIPALCGLFVFINHSQLFLIHQTAKEFLVAQVMEPQGGPSLWKACLLESEVEYNMTTICATFLHLSCAEDSDTILRPVQNGDCGWETESGSSALELSANSDNFWQYCAVYWTLHMREDAVRDNKKLLQQVMSLFQTNTILFSRWFSFMWEAIHDEEAPVLNFQHVVAITGHVFVLEKMLESDNNDTSIDTTDSTDRTALVWAAKHGHEAMVRLLLERGADVNGQGGENGSALQAASEGGHEAVVRLLLERGASVNAQGGLYGTALQAALFGGHKAVVQLLLERGANINALGSLHGSALQAASEEGHKAVVQLLLERGADVNAQGIENGNALYAASLRGHKAVVQLLLEHGADVNSQGGHYGSALQAASSEGHEAVIRLLLERGANFHDQGGGYDSAL